MDDYIGSLVAGNSSSQVQSDWNQNDDTAPDYIKNKPIPTPPSSDGTYNLQVTVSSGSATYSWVSTS